MPPVETTELITETEFGAEITRIEDRFDKLEKKVDRLLLAVVANTFVIVAAIIGTRGLT